MLGPGQGSTATREVAPASSMNRTVIHYHSIVRPPPYPEERPGWLKALVRAVHGVRGSDAAAAQSRSGLLLAPLEHAMRAAFARGVTGFFDTPWSFLFAELYLSMCARGVRVVLSTRDARSWAKSRRRSKSLAGFVCPFAPDPRLLDPFSPTQCAAFGRRHANESGPAAPRRLAAAKPRRLFGLDYVDVAAADLAVALAKYNEYVQRLVPDDLLLRVDYFSSSFLRPRADGSVDVRAEWTAHQRALIEAFLRD